MNVEVFFTGGSCDDGSEARVVETASTVEITVVTRLQRVSGCDDVDHPRSVVAVLDEPLGSRTLEDGSCNHPEWDEARHCTRDGAPPQRATGGWRDAGVPYVKRDGEQATYFDCATPSGDCELLGQVADDHGEGFESSARGQLAATLGSE